METNTVEEQFEEKLIQLVSQFDFLFNTKSRSYKNVLKRDSSWQQIAEQLNKPVTECRQRWRSLRDRFVKEKKRLEQPSGSGAVDVSVWEFYESLQFLNDAVQPRKQVGNYGLFSESETPQFSPTNESSCTFTDYSPPEPPTKRPAKRSRPADVPAAEFFGSLSKTLTERFKAEEPDENELFMKMLAKKMKALPEEAAIRLQEKFLKEVNDEILAFKNVPL